MSIVERPVLNAIDRLLVYKGHDLKLLNLLRLQIDDHDALARYLFADQDLADQHYLGRIKVLTLLAKRLR